MTSATKKVLPFAFDTEGNVVVNPEDIVFVERTNHKNSAGMNGYITRHTEAGNPLLCIKKALIQDLFPGETKFDFSRGQHPNEAWLKITPNKRGVKLVGALYFSIGSIVPRDRIKAGDRHDVELHPRTDALYVKLPWELIK